MLSASLLLTLLSTVPAPPLASGYSADEGQCASVEDAVAVDGGAAADAPEGDVAPCSYEPAWTPAPAVIDCNDVRASIWVGTMIGVCDMPRNQLPTSLRPAPAPVRGFTCEGPSCARHHQPLRAVERSDDNTRPILSARLMLLPPSVFMRMPHDARRPPRSAERDRVERPPRV